MNRSGSKGKDDNGGEGKSPMSNVAASSHNNLKSPKGYGRQPSPLAGVHVCNCDHDCVATGTYVCDLASMMTAMMHTHRQPQGVPNGRGAITNRQS